MAFALPLALLLIAALYASVGHGGASGYIAVMALAGLAPETIRPTALMMNVVVAGIATAQFARAGHFRWALLWPFAVAAVPFAWLGGRVPLDAGLFGLVVGAVLLLSAARLFWQPREATHQRALSLVWALPVGALLGLISGLVGVGGGIFLTPLLLFVGWARAHVAARLGCARTRHGRCRRRCTSGRIGSDHARGCLCTRFDVRCIHGRHARRNSGTRGRSRCISACCGPQCTSR